MTGKGYSIVIRRYDPNVKPHYREEQFTVPGDDRTTVLQALIYIYTHLDPGLAFAYCCRYARCGLCAVEVNGRPVLACTTFLKGKTTVAPLSNLPPLRDLMINREPLERLLHREKIYFQGDTLPLTGTIAPDPGEPFFPAGPLQDASAAALPDRSFFPAVNAPASLEVLLGCLECLCCHARCPEVAAAAGNLDSFAGPFVFLKLAQLHLDPRDRVDRKTQAHRLGVSRCLNCRHCSCPQGIPLYREAILPLLEG